MKKKFKSRRISSGNRGLEDNEMEQIIHNDMGVMNHGKIFLYGETHSEEKILEKELQLWSGYYADGMRNLFVEMPYYTAEFMNIWMQSKNDNILDEIFTDCEGTDFCSPKVKKFYKGIKENYPDTVLHGTDVGHQYSTTGERYLEYLRSEGKENSEQYILAKEAIEQGKYYYDYSDDVYRENTMTQNFIREFDKLGGTDIMGIYGLAHTQIDAPDRVTHTVPCMANQLSRYYGETVSSEDLTALAYAIEPLKTEILQIGDVEYEASYFGKQDLSANFPEYECREFWRLKNAYDDFKNRPTTGDVLPYDNFPMIIAESQVFVIDYTKKDGSVVRRYYRSDGNLWQDLLTTEEFCFAIN